jgi:hypothetical protein
MHELLKDKEHLARVAALFLVGIVAFLVLRGLMVPRGFGVYGHFRAGALDDNRARPLVYAGRARCEGCHTDVAEARAKSKHGVVACEACHGALARHADDPEASKPTLPDGRAICLVCHTANVAKPKGFAQIDPRDHGEGASCKECHKPHQPEEMP